MRIAIREIHPSPSPAALNGEWFVVENIGDKPFSIGGCTLSVGKASMPRLRGVGTIDPGFTMQPSEKVRVITGNPGKKAHGPAPEEAAGVRSYHLFLTAPLVGGAGSILAVSLKQHELARATFDPAAQGGVAPTGD